MAWLTGKVQNYSREGSKDHSTGDCPYYEKDGKYYLKETGEEITLEIRVVDLSKLMDNQRLN